MAFSFGKKSELSPVERANIRKAEIEEARVLRREKELAEFKIKAKKQALKKFGPQKSKIQSLKDAFSKAKSAAGKIQKTATKIRKGKIVSGILKASAKQTNKLEKSPRKKTSKKSSKKSKKRKKTPQRNRVEDAFKDGKTGLFLLK